MKPFNETLLSQRCFGVCLQDLYERLVEAERLRAQAEKQICSLEGR